MMEDNYMRKVQAGLVFSVRYFIIMTIIIANFFFGIGTGHFLYNHPVSSYESEWVLITFSILFWLTGSIFFAGKCLGRMTLRNKND